MNLSTLVIMISAIAFVITLAIGTLFKSHKSWIVTYLQNFTGVLFIFSGFIKSNDSIGFSYKLEEYFENGALAYRIRDWFGWDSFSLEFLMEHALLLAIIMCAAEIILGFAVLFGTKIKFAVYSLLFYQLHSFVMHTLLFFRALLRCFELLSLVQNLS